MDESVFSIDTGLFLIYDEEVSGYAVYGIEDFNNENLVIPSSYNEIPVKKIINQAFVDCRFLKSVVIPESIIYIEPGSFENCFNIESITMPMITNEIFAVDNAYFG